MFGAVVVGDRRLADWKLPHMLPPTL